MKAILRHTMLSVSALALILSLLLIPVSTVLAQSLFEYWDGTPSENESREVWVNHGQGLAFTAESDHSVNGLDLMMYRRGTTGPVTISIYAADDSFLPVGPVLTSTVIDGDSLPLDMSNAMWKFISFATPINVTLGNKYAITLEAAFPSSGAVGLREDTEAPTYSQGAVLYNPGVSWTISTTAHTVLFRVYDLPAGSSLTLVPATASNRIYTEHTLTATYLGISQSGVNVNFEVMAGPNKGDTGSAVPNGSGVATFSYTGDGGPGKDYIRATAVDDESQPLVITEATKDWTGVLSLVLAPSSSINPVNTQHTLTATCLVDGAPLPGISVEFSVEFGPNEGDTGSDITDVNGQAVFSYTGDGGLGQDYIQAIIVNQADEALAGDSATKNWTGPFTLDLDPSSASSPVNTQHTVTATCLADGTPIPDVNVNFEVMTGPNAGDTGSAVTDFNGQAFFSYTGDGGLGQDYIQAIVVNQADETLARDDATMDWTDIALPQGVGGDVYPVYKLGVMAPWIVLIMAFIAGVICLTRHKTSSSK